jgi:hypothetical protein
MKEVDVPQDPAAISPAYAMERIFTEIRDKRAYQDQKWGGPEHDDSVETEDSWIKYINEYASGKGRAEGRAFRERMIHVAALAVAAIQSFDRKQKTA